MIRRITYILSALVLAVGTFIINGCEKKPDTGKPVSTQTVQITKAQPPLQSSETSPPVQQTAGKAKNMILLIGDGMGFSQLTLGRIANGNKDLVMDTIKDTGYVSTWPDDANEFFVTDSAAAGTAMATGVKTNNNAISVDNSGKEQKTILEYAKEAGKATGLVTTSRLTDATPAVFAAHDTRRGNEEAIALDMLETAPDILMGGGAQNFKSDSREDKKDLVGEAKQAGYTVVEDAAGLQSTKADKLFGLFAEDKMPYVIDRNKNKPSLKDMAIKALGVLSKDPDGFFVMIEGGRIDHACHAHDTPAAAKEVLAFDEAVASALDFAKEDGNTLVIITADHETGGLSIGAESQGTTFIDSMLKKQKGSIFESIINDVDWAAEPDYAAFVKEHFGIDKLSPAELDALKSAYTAEKTDRKKNANYFGRALASLDSARTNTGWTTRSHGGSDVPAFAYGPFAEKIAGHLQNTDIFVIMKEALAL